ncbi:hypothetical protein [Nocardioides convexus]|uniref:hypothetical protein n=1 Tax=Nocardioides convexus TaxID=2712224 RepID=UPI002418AAA0|nr:hypothetical protein [Nocardioides convexus]
MLWDPRFFGIRPQVVMKSGTLVWGALGDPNASIPTPQPVLMRPTLVEDGSNHAVTFVSPAALADGLADRLGLRRRLAEPPADPRGDQGRHGQQHRAAAHRHRPGDLRDRRRRRARRPVPGDRVRRWRSFYAMF